MAEWLRDLRRCAPSREFESGRVQIFFRFSETVLTNWLISLKCLQIVPHSEDDCIVTDSQLSLGGGVVGGSWR